MISTRTSQISEERERGELTPTQRYIRWIREELNTGRWSADTTQPCLLYKVYKGVKHIPLDSNVPLRLGKSYKDIWQYSPGALQARPAQKLSWLLYYTHGLTRILRPEAGIFSTYKTERDPLPTLPKSICGPVAHSSPFLGRPVPSGGALHPTEIYLALGDGGKIPAGCYHYDSCHHALDQLRIGDVRAEIAACLPSNPGLFPDTVMVLLTDCVQKNHQKYSDLSYCLQALEAGIVIEQVRFAAECFTMTSALHLCFLDAPLHHLFGLNPREESIYAVILLNTRQAGSSPAFISEKQIHTSTHSIADLPALSIPHIQPFPLRPQSPLLEDLYSASLLDRLYPQDETNSTFSNEEEAGREELSLPAASLPQNHDIAQILLRRRTSFNAIDTREIRLEDLSTLLWPLQRLDSRLWQNGDCHLYCVVSRVPSLLPGVYRYRRETHTLLPVHSEQILTLLMSISTAENIHPDLVPVNLFFCGNHQRAQARYGERGFRLLEIEIGRALQYLSLVAAASTLATHTHLSYAIEGTRKRLLRLTEAELPLASMMIGYPKKAQESLFDTIWY